MAMAEQAGDNKNKPWLWVISGPNGAGKTTFAERFLTGSLSGVPFVNIDNLALGITRASAGEAAIQASRFVSAPAGMTFPNLRSGDVSAAD